MVTPKALPRTVTLGTFWSYYHNRTMKPVLSGIMLSYIKTQKYLFDHYLHFLKLHIIKHYTNSLFIWSRRLPLRPHVVAGTLLRRKMLLVGDSFQTDKQLLEYSRMFQESIYKWYTIFIILTFGSLLNNLDLNGWQCTAGWPPWQLFFLHATNYASMK